MLLFLYLFYLIPLGAILCLSIALLVVHVMQRAPRGAKLHTGGLWLGGVLSALAALWFVPILQVVPLSIYFLVLMTWEVIRA